MPYNHRKIQEAALPLLPEGRSYRAENRMSLRMKLLLPITGLIVLIMAVSSYISYNQAANGLKISLIDNMRGEAQSLARAIATMAQTALEDIDGIASNGLVEEFFQRENFDASAVDDQSAVLGTILSHYPNLDRISLLDRNGKTVASTTPGAVGSPFGDRSYFQKALAGEANISDPLLSRVSGKATLIAAAPVKVRNAVVGVAYVAMSLDHFFENHVKPVRIGREGYAYVLNKTGLVAVHHNPDVLFKNDLPGTADYRRMAEASQPGVMEFTGITGTPVYSYYVKEEFTGLTAVVQAEYQDVFADLDVMRDSFLVVGLCSVLIATLMLFFLLRPILRALQATIVFAGKVAAGDLSGFLEIRRKDELGQMAQALQSIPATIKEVLGEYHSLEQRIAKGDLDASGNTSRFSGEFATLIKGTNLILDRFRNIIDDIPSAIVMMDSDRKLRYVNKAGKSLCAGEYKNRPYREVIFLEDNQSPDNALSQSVKNKTPQNAETVIHIQNEKHDVQYTVFPMLDENGNLSSLLQLIIDLTAIKETQRTIQSVAVEASSISGRVAESTQQLSTQVEDVTQRGQTQRSSVESIASAIAEMNSSVLEIARNAGRASEQSNETRTQAENGADLVQQVVAAINKVNSVAEILQKNMNGLGSKAESIGGVMNVISDIADQTNLLALNAAIEAARAGDAGRGFAVVADEVRKLAEKTMTATNEVGTSITAIQQSTQISIAEVNNAVSAITEATKLADESGRSLAGIVGLATESSGVVASIATAAEEQSATSDEITRAIEEINRQVNMTTDGMGHASSAVTEVTQMVLDLNRVLEKLSLTRPVPA
jgi:methyl-accepting chemotaxis protein